MGAQYVIEVLRREEVQVTMPNGQRTLIPSVQAVALITNMAAKGISGALVVRGGRTHNQDVLEAALKAAKLEGFQAMQAQASGRIEF